MIHRHHMPTESAPRRTALFVILFLLLSAFASIPRFGERENEHSPGVSDSDLYIEMARVFTGELKQFTKDYVAWQPHHYNRPCLPFLAGYFGKFLLGGNLRAAFSLINIVAATVVALLLMKVVQRHRPEWQLSWLPSVLFLTGFPQLNWGYHIFTDTLGYATALSTACYAAWLIEQIGQTAPWNKSALSLHLTLLFASSSVAFLTRETAWFAVITAIWLVAKCPRVPHDLLKQGLIPFVLVLGKLPHVVYAYAYAVSGVPLKSSLSALLNWPYLFDFTVKTAVCFNLAWLLAVWGFLRAGGRSVPPLFTGWSVAALFYIGAGYYVNKIHLIGYPLRMSYALFPSVYYGVTALLEKRLSEQRRVPVAIAFFLVQYGINLVGLFLDPGRPGIKAADVLKSLRDFLSN
jgi:hypothetical protein